MIKKIRLISVVIIDIFIILTSLMFVSYVFDINLPVLIPSTSLIIFSYLILNLAIMNTFGLYRSLWRYAGVDELIRIILSVITSSLVVLTISLVSEIEFLPGELHLMNGLLLFLGLFGFRYSYRLLRFYKSTIQRRNNFKRTLIIGAGDAGVLVLNELLQNLRLKSKVVGFIDDDKRKIGLKIQGLPIYGPIDNIENVIKERDIEEVIIAIKNMSIERKAEIINLISYEKVNIKILDSIRDYNDVIYPEIKDIDIEELLGRQAINLEESGINEFIHKKVVLVTGAGGSIGSELCRNIIKYVPRQLIILDIYENGIYDVQRELLDYIEEGEIETELITLIASIRDELRILSIFERYSPRVVFHAAAHKHVPLMEDNPADAIKNNIFGTHNVVIAADRYRTSKFVLISTDKAVNPTNVMGATKRFAELIIQAYNSISYTEFSAVRFGNVLGSNGSVIPLFKKQIKKGGPVTVTHPEIIRYFMTIPEACQLVLQSCVYAKGGEIFVLDMGEPIKIHDLAKKIIKQSGYEPYKDIDIKFTGLRPGEKMYEELLVQPDKLTRTDNKKIFIENIDEILPDDIESYILELQSVIKSDDNIYIKNELSSIITTYEYVK